MIGDLSGMNYILCSLALTNDLYWQTKPMLKDFGESLISCRSTNVVGEEAGHVDTRQEIHTKLFEKTSTLLVHNSGNLT